VFVNFIDFDYFDRSLYQSNQKNEEPVSLALSVVEPYDERDNSLVLSLFVDVTK